MRSWRRADEDPPQTREERRAPAGSGESGSRSQGASPGGLARVASAIAAALRQGVGATRGRSQGLPSQISRRLQGGLLAGFGIYFDLLGFVLNLIIALIRLVADPLALVLGRLRGAVDIAARAVTPARALTAVVGGAAILLALSQFADYRGVSIGTDAYAEVETVAPAPERERSETGSAHGYAMVPLAIVALALLAAAHRGRRWQLCRLIALGGLAAILVGLLVDRPAGLDPGETAVAYEGVRASLLGGFYAQLFAGLLMAVSALLLGRELRGGAAASPARRAGRSPRDGGRRILRGGAEAEGAGA